MTKLLIALSILSLLAIAGPVAADDHDEATDPIDEDVVLLEPCENTGGNIVVTPDEPFDEVIDTPVGALGLVAADEVGRFQVDLAGFEEGTRARVTFTLSFDNPVSDYDLVIDGHNEFSVDNPEIYVLNNRQHCSSSLVEVEVFIGVPIDEVNLRVEVTPLP